MGTILKIGGVLAGIIGIYVAYVYFTKNKDVNATAGALANTATSLGLGTSAVPNSTTATTPAVTGKSIPNNSTGTVIIKDIIPATSAIPGFADNGAHDKQMWYDTISGYVAHAN